jgi:hypothetical protein
MCLMTPNARVQPRRAERSEASPSAGTRSASLELPFKCIELFRFDDDSKVVRNGGN